MYHHFFNHCFHYYTLLHHSCTISTHHSTCQNVSFGILPWHLASVRVCEVPIYVMLQLDWLSDDGQSLRHKAPRRRRGHLDHRMRPFGREIATEIWDTIWSWKIWLSCLIKWLNTVNTMIFWVFLKSLSDLCWVLTRLRLKLDLQNRVHIFGAISHRPHQKWWLAMGIIPNMVLHC